MADFLTIPEIIRAAEKNLPSEIWDYASGGADTETTLRRNRVAMERIALCQRVLAGVQQRDTSTDFLGRRLSLPVMLAPVGGLTKFDANGALAVAIAAERIGTFAFISTVTAPGLEEVAGNTSCPLVFQLYSYGDRDWVKGIVRRAERAGYVAICLTADTAVYGRRDRDLANRYFPRQSVPERPNLAELPSGLPGPDFYQASLTWEYLSWLRDLTSLPLILKGVMEPDDAVRAVEHGVDVIYVSNHGGRQLDHAPAAIEVLAEVVKAVAGRAEVLVDSGFQRGTDVVKGLALGAKAVLIGKLLVWSLGADGEDGLHCALEILTKEIDVAMGLIGVKNIQEIGPHVIRPSLPNDI
ncbi:MAG: alpha-hydroxy acid oxidase [Dehalococcoidia bacterium]|nr:alpha-hydroxy acid oxidase [Dehalococcoidia bacterium]